ncbi:unnamed protein product, partial [Rotaria socialis]
MTYASGGGSELGYTIVGDMNNDGRLDIIIAKYGSDSHPSLIAIGDFIGDNELDFSVAYDRSQRWA